MVRNSGNNRFNVKRAVETHFDELLIAGLGKMGNSTKTIQKEQ